MTNDLFTRRKLLAAGSAVAVTGMSGLIVPARAQGLAPTRSMRGGSNNYRPNA
ncbi:MAG: twin-arginine translocation pathway signal, partial [Pseudomonadota bacterium]